MKAYPAQQTLIFWIVMIYFCLFLFVCFPTPWRHKKNVIQSFLSIVLYFSFFNRPVFTSLKRNAFLFCAMCSVLFVLSVLSLLSVLCVLSYMTIFIQFCITILSLFSSILLLLLVNHQIVPGKGTN